MGLGRQCKMYQSDGIHLYLCVIGHSGGYRDIHSPNATTKEFELEFEEENWVDLHI